MNHHKGYFFCGIGGSGMLPLALILREGGARVAGSDRALDQGRTAEKFAFLRQQGIALFPQDGSGVAQACDTVVVSAAIEETVPDIAAARRLGATIKTRAELLAELFNAAIHSVAVGGTSGKSTTTGMVGLIFQEAGRAPTIMNGAVMKNFLTAERPFASAVVGNGDLFVSEVDESDGSIARYRPEIAVLNNVSLDHKSLEELRGLFAAFIGKARRAVLNLDDGETVRLAEALEPGARLTYSLGLTPADYSAHDIRTAPDGIICAVAERESGQRLSLRLKVPGRHNVSNALAALAAARALGVSLEVGVSALEGFLGIRRRLETVGVARGITVIDDFAHNPDKIEATLATLHAHPGRLLILFQPHGYGPLKLMREALIGGFADNLGAEDILVLCDPAYFGGTVDRAVTSGDIVAGVRARGRIADHIADRSAASHHLVDMARPGDRIIVMGARDDTLSEVAQQLLAALEG